MKWPILPRRCLERLSGVTLFCASTLGFMIDAHVIAQEQREGTESHRYVNKRYGIEFTCPASWQLYTPDAPGLFPFDANQLAVCVNGADARTNFNVRSAVGPPPNPFLQKIETTLNQAAQALNATRLSFRGLSVSGNDAAEMVLAYAAQGSQLKQKLLVVSRPAVGFIWTFTAPAGEFDGTDRDVFGPTLMATRFSGPPLIPRLWYGMPPWLRGVIIGPAVFLTIAAFFRVLAIVKRRLKGEQPAA